MIKLQTLIVLAFFANFSRILVVTFFAFFNIFRIIGRHLTTFVEAPRNPYETMLKPLTFFVISTKEKWAATWQNQQCGFAPSEDSDQPGHPRSLIRVFCPHEETYPLSASEDSDQTGRMPRLIWVFAGRTLILLVLSCRGSNVKKCEKCFCEIF